MICLVDAFDSREYRDRLSTVRLPLIDRSATPIPIIIVANKCDLMDEIRRLNNDNRAFFRLTMSQYSRIEVCIETSTQTMKKIFELLYSGQKCVLYPINSLKEQNRLTRRFQQGLKRIFTNADQLLNDEEMGQLQDFCFGKIPVEAIIKHLKVEIKRRAPVLYLDFFSGGRA